MRQVGDHQQIVGDDLLVTNPNRIKKVWSHHQQLSDLAAKPNKSTADAEGHSRSQAVPRHVLALIAELTAPDETSTLDSRWKPAGLGGWRLQRPPAED